MNFYQDAIFERQNLLQKGEYENCTILNCNLGESDLTSIKFIDSVFINCNLSLSKVYKASFQNVSFKECKMLGFRFDTCNEFNLSFSFEKCQLNHSSFYKTKIKKTVFCDCHLQETDFTETDLTGAIFDKCDLTRAVFNHTVLEKADFRSSCNFSIDPEVNKIKKAMFSLEGVAGLLNKYGIEIHP